MSNPYSRILRALLGLAAVAGFALGGLAQTAPTFANVTVHDPSVVRDGSTFYVFGSHLASASSTDLMHWTQITTDWNAATNPTCSLIRNSSPQTEFSTALSYTTPPDFWAPDVRKLGDGRYYFYYCVCNGTSRSALGLAVADAITGPYSNVAIMLESGMAGASPDGTTYNNAVHPNVVDPSVFSDNTGKLWMVYGSYSGGIFILSLDPATGQPYAGQAYGKKLTGGNNCRIEGAFILYSPQTAYYYLFFTFGGLDANGGYNIRVGRSHNPDGPYLDAAGNDLTNVKGAPNTVFDDVSIAPYGVKLMGNYQFLHVAADPQITSRGYVSPGGPSAYYDGSTGKYLLVFHTRFVGQGETHEVRVHQFFLNADGWPVVAPQRYAQETIATADASQLVGDFKLINHGKDITATVKTSSVITLNGDRSISGAVTGSWQLTGDHFATLTLAGTSYAGVFARVWDDDNQIWTQAFTAVSTDGVSVWGTMVAPHAASPVITTSPAAQTAATGHSVRFQVVATTATSFQWQESSNNGTSWTSLTDNSTYSGSTTAALTLSSLTAGMNGYLYRVLVTNAGGTSTSNTAALSVAAPVFPSPSGIAVKPAGGLVVSDSLNNTVQTVTAAGVATLLAGTSGQQGSADGAGSVASFRQPDGIALDAAGNVLVADTGNSLVRKITTDGVVTTVAGSASNQGYRDGTGTAAWFNLPTGVALDNAGNLYVADSGNSVVRRITTSGAVTTFAGSAGVTGSADGAAGVAQFNLPAGVAVGSGGVIFVADTINNTIRQIDSAGKVTTLAGLPGVAGFDDGTGMGATFNHPDGLVVDAAGNLYLADTGNSTIRRITPAGSVTTLAGTPGVAGLEDGVGLNALFNQPKALAIDSGGTLYVADSGNAAIRKVTTDGNVTTMVITAAATGGSSGGTGSGGTSSGGGTTSGGGTSSGSGSTSTGGGGGGGATSPWCLGALLILGLARRAKRHHRSLRS